jgi:UDP-N-acetylmuramoyl-L-alanyl-D-glutamate--2,6-diaminopimelate ligase
VERSILNMTMKLKKLLKDISVSDVKGSKDIVITGLCANSKVVSPGNLFVAKKGRVDDGAQYIQEAIAAGASAVLTDIYDPSLRSVTQVIHPDVSSVESLLAAHYYQFPSQELFMVGITGTNGKTTTSFLVKYLLDQLNVPCGLIGTIEYIIGKHRYQATRTTPDVISNHKMLREMVLQDCKSAVMEVTSHALDQGRAQNVHFDVAIFTNLTLDHLDYHQTMEDYCQVKQKLFSGLNSKSSKGPATAVINIDSPWHAQMLQNCSANVLAYGLGAEANVRASTIKLSSAGTDFTVTYKGESIHCRSPLVGRFNVYNYLAALCVGLARQVPIKKLVDILSSFPRVPGRLEQIENALGLNIFVDFAHSDDALINVLECLQEFKKGRIITVFGCGGDRDRTKRPKMAKAAEEFSDFCIVTSDNPRSEDPQQICNEIIKGFQDKDKWMMEIDRREAIKKAIHMATPDDIILIAGKGHETYQIFAHTTVEFDDRKISAQLCIEKQ